jgi:glycosyltransferase involved in cell wall biosynthesis
VLQPDRREVTVAGDANVAEATTLSPRQHAAGGITVTVVVPSYNQGHLLPRCLAAIAAQTRPPDEVIIIDDASDDESLALAQSYAVGRPTWRVLANPKNGGVIAAINRGLAEARSSHVLFTATDDWILPELVRTSAELLSRHPQAGLCSALTLVNDERGPAFPLQSSIVCRIPAYIAPERARRLLRRHANWFVAGTVVLNRAWAREVGGFRPELQSFSDMFVYYALALTHGACFIPRPLGVWTLLPGSYSGALGRNPAEMKKILDHGLALMRGPFREHFPADVTRRWELRWRYAMACGALELDADAIPHDAAPGHSLRALRRVPVIGRHLARAYLFLRFRPGDVIETTLRRLRWTFGPADFGLVQSHGPALR